MLKALGSKNYIQARSNIATGLCRYEFLFGNKFSYDSLYKKIWSPVYDPKDPLSDWGVGVFKEVFPVQGENSAIVPEGSIGYLLDSTCQAGYENRAYFATLIRNHSVEEGDTVYASVYCFVSHDFDGNMVAIETDKEACGRIAAEYDYKRKGTWQKLNLKAGCLKGEAPVYLYINKAGASDFRKMKGYVIFAHPETGIYRADKAKPVSDNIKTDSRRISFHGYPIHENRSLMSFSIPYALFVRRDSIVDLDPLRNWILHIFSEDTTYIGTKSLVIKPNTSTKSSDSRLELWKFSISIFKHEYPFLEKIFGGGFKFLNWFGYKFDGNKTETDYPHNPFLHILLYSGILGLIIYCVFLYGIFRFYLKYLKEYPLYFIFFLIIFFFGFFSSGSPFDPPVLGFFSILPYFIHTLHFNGNSVIKSENNE